MPTLEDIISIPNRSILYSQTIRNLDDAKHVLDENNLDIVVYNISKEYSLSKVCVLEKDNDGNYYYQFEPQFKLNGDMVDNIEIDAGNLPCNICYYIGGNKYTLNELTPFANLSVQYYDIQLRVTFLEKPTNDAVFTIRSRHYALAHPIRRALAQNNIDTEHVIYRSGMMGRPPADYKYGEFTSSCHEKPYV